MTDSAIDRRTVSDWVTAYRRAWGSNTDEDIRALFTEDGEYLGGPSDTPIAGVDAIVASWISQAEKPDDTTFEWQIVGIDGDTGFVQGRVNYVTGELYDNLWVIRFGDGGRARSFTEWWMKRPGSR